MTIRSDPWKFESIWRSTVWRDQDTLAEFLASTGTLYISEKIIDSPDTYFVLSGDRIYLYDNGSVVESWVSSAPTPPPEVETGVPMGLLVALTYQT